MDVMVEGRGSHLDGDFGTGDDELDLNLSHFWDFPLENVSADDFVGDWDDSNLEPLGPITLMPPTVQCRKVDTFPVDEQMDESHKPKQLPNYVGIAFGSCILDQNASTETQESDAYQSQSPDTVVESSSSYWTGIFGAVPAQPRSRTVKIRPRLKPWNLMSAWHSTKSGSGRTSNYRKNKGRKKLSGNSVSSLQSSDSVERQNYSLLRSGATKKCTHCGITKTPQWRDGPLGPKTLCNACGVRYRSGRLFPEYRPAASPSFVPDLHSNSHKKVLEMRNKATPHTRKMDESQMLPVGI